MVLCHSFFFFFFFVKVHHGYRTLQKKHNYAGLKTDPELVLELN